MTEQRNMYSNMAFGEGRTGHIQMRNDPCPMHGANSTGLGYDPFYVDDDGERDDELNEYQAERLERIRAKRGTKEREDLIRRIAEDKVTRKKGDIPRSLEPDAIDAIDLDDLFD